MSAQNKMFEASLITLGDGQVGKTSLIYRYIDDTFTFDYLSTIGIDSKKKIIKLENNEQIKVKIFDTAGQERFRSITSNYIKKANGILLIYSVDNPKSFENIETWYQSISEDENKNKLPVVLIGNKSDLEEKRQISKETGIDLAEKFGIENHFYETSCKTGENVEKAINDLVNQIYEKFGSKNNNSSSLKISSQNNEMMKKKKCC
jgi:small GTP-binding protein